MLSFEEAVSHFEEITIAEARTRIDSEEKLVLFIGRPTCSFCRRFAPKLAAVAQATGAKVAYVHSQDMDEIEAIQAFRNRYGIATVPALFVAENGSAKVVCDSSLTEEDITDFIF